MANVRSLILSTDETYHVFNRSVERRPVFTSKREYQHMKDLIRFYRFAHLPMRYSQYSSLSVDVQKNVIDRLEQKGDMEVSLYAFSLMPNHFHFTLKQMKDNGVTTFLSNISNSFAKYFNIRHKRTGSLWQHPFKAVHIETDEQLLHVIRYTHINPVVGLIIKEEELDTYPWTSLPEYLLEHSESICDTHFVKSQFHTINSLRSFTHDQVGYKHQFAKIEHLAIDVDTDE